MNAPSDKDVREMLERRAADVRPSPDAWDRIAARLDREPQARRSRHVLVRMPGRRGPRTVGGAPAPATFRWLAAAAVVAVVAVASVVVGDRPPDRRVTTAPPATVPLPAPEAGDDAEDVVAVWPAPTVLGLEAVQARVDAGDQPELLDPEQAARTYLAQRLGFIERGPAPALSVGRFRGEDASNGEVAYVASGVRGTVVLRRVGGEGAIWSVVASTSEHLAVHMFGYDGRRVTGEVVPAADGRLSVHLAGPDATLATASPAEAAGAGRPVAVDGALPGEAGVVVLLRLVEDGGGGGVTEFVLDAPPPA